MSLLNAFETSRRSLRAYGRAMEVAGENVSNAQTPGYVRRRLELTPSPSPGGTLKMGATEGPGTGPSASAVRLRDDLLRTARLDAETRLGGADAQARLLEPLEGVMGVNGRALSDSFSAFWNSLEDAATHPTELGVRQAVLGRADAVAGTFRRLASGVSQLGDETRAALDDGLKQVNGLLEEVAALSQQTRQARTAGAPDFAAEDRRDEAVRALASWLPVRVQENGSGFVLTSNGLTLVQDGRAAALKLGGEDGPLSASVVLGGTGVALGDAGRLGALTRTLGETLPQTMEALDALAARFSADVNTLHRQGFGLDDSTGSPLFSGARAATLDVAVRDPRKLAFSDAPQAPGNGRGALSMAALRDGLDAGAIEIPAGIGRLLSAAHAEANASEALVDYTAELEARVSGVSLDEEMTRLIEAQQAYAASARVLSTAQAMMDTLLSI